MGRILRRYVYREIATPFLFALLLFTVILFTVRILKLVELVVNKGVPVQQILEIFLYVIPAFFEVTVPMSLLLAILWGFGRFSADREIIALRSCGISFSQMAFPVGILTTGVLIGTFFLTLYVRPWSNTALKQVLYELAKTRATAALREKTFNDEFTGVVIYTEEIQPPGTFLRGVMIADTRNPQQKNTIFARDGLVITNDDNQSLTLRLREGTIHSVELPKKSYQATHFSIYDLTLNLNTPLIDTKKSIHEPQEMSLHELNAAISRKQSEGISYNVELSELYRRLSLPFSCVVFAFIALPLSIRPAWSFRSHGFAISLMIILTYYLLLTIGETLGKGGSLWPGIALWLPNMILGIVGISLFLRATQERSPLSGRAWRTRLASSIGLWDMKKT